MKFIFSLESVLKHRRRLEDQAKREYLEAKHAVDTLLGEINEMYLRIDQTREAIHQETLGHSTAPRLEFLSAFIEGQKVKIETARKKARELLAIAEEKQELLIHAQKEKKVLEKLKDRRWLEFKKDRRHREIKQLDEIVTMRSGRGEER